MSRFAWTYLTTAGVMLAMDAVWLSVMAGRLYRPQLGSLLRDNFDPLAAAIFYLLFVGGLVALVSIPAWEGGRWSAAIGRGALFGLVAYATYDLTNQATMRGWSWLVTAADLAWGTVLSGISAGLGLYLARQIMRLS